jgi:ferrochelatase
MSFGGPEKNEDVIPFLENVTEGRGIPKERLAEVGEHYFHFGGKSPITDQNIALIQEIEKELAHQNINLPVYFGNRNWDPYISDTMQKNER